MYKISQGGPYRGLSRPLFMLLRAFQLGGLRSLCIRRCFGFISRGCVFICMRFCFIYPVSQGLSLLRLMGADGELEAEVEGDDAPMAGAPQEADGKCTKFPRGVPIGGYPAPYICIYMRF